MKNQDSKREKPIIEIRNLGKRYDIQHTRGGYIALRDVLMNIIKKPFSFAKNRVKRAVGISNTEEFWALKNINFSINRGEVVGIIGANGAGKSTLLKILTGITPPSEGEAILRGRVSSLLEVGTGFHPELTGRENIFLNGAILGMKKKEIQKKFDEIVSFAGIEKFLDTPVKHYSSGMYVRLAFSVAAHMEPDILLVDEVLAVGDAEFQKKCLGKMEEVTKESGRTILFVSHNMGAIQNLCSKTILLKDGQIKSIGETDEIIDEYLKDISNRNVADIAKRKDRQGNGELKIVDAYLLDNENQRTNSMISGKDTNIAIEYECKPDIKLKNVIIGLGIVSSKGEAVSLFHSEMTMANFGIVEGKGKFVCKINNIPLVPGTYFINARIINGGEVLDYMQNIIPIDVLDGNFFGTGSSIRHSLVYIKHNWENQKI